MFFLAGQSNINGATQGSTVPNNWNYVQQDVWIWLDDRQSGGQWTSLGPGHGGIVHSPRSTEPIGLDPLNRIGPEVSLGRALADLYPADRIALIKHAEGSNIHTHWNPAAASGNDMWTTLLQKANNAFAALSQAGHSYQIDAVFWAQGHADARNFSYPSSDPAVVEAGRQSAMEYSSHYQENFTRLISAFRDEFGAGLPFIVSNPIFGTPDRWPYFPGIGLVREQTAAVAAQVPDVYVFDVDDLLTTDGIHFTAPAQIQHGERFADTYIAAVAVPEPSTIVLSALAAIALLATERRSPQPQTLKYRRPQLPSASPFEK